MEANGKGRAPAQASGCSALNSSPSPYLLGIFDLLQLCISASVAKTADATSFVSLLWG